MVELEKKYTADDMRNICIFGQGVGVLLKDYFDRNPEARAAYDRHDLDAAEKHLKPILLNVKLAKQDRKKVEEYRDIPAVRAMLIELDFVVEESESLLANIEGMKHAEAST